MGISFSSVARNQLQAMQMTFFFFLPSIILSGFMFPFRGILLKGNAILELWPALWPIVAFMLAVIAIGLRFSRRSLD